MRRLPALEIVASFGVGHDHVDAKWARAGGVIVTHTPGALDDEVADTAMALTMMVVRRLPQAERFLRAGAARPNDRNPGPWADREGDRDAREIASSGADSSASP
jgi:lactate dehydrogenase-like 2-hydroxyacid dehydrogenase